MTSHQPYFALHRPQTPQRSRRYRSVACLLLAGGVFACSSASASSEVTSEAATAQAELDAAPRDRAAAAPLAELQPSSTPAIAGEISEVLSAGSYTYFRLESDGQDRWIVIMGDALEIGARVHVTIMGEREDFYSPRLDREFARLSFARLDDLDGGAA